jgi:hypothetical protein
MYPARTQKLAEAPITGPHRQAERDRVAYTARQAPRASHHHAVRGLARRLLALLASLDFRQLAGPMAIFFLWPPRPRRGPVTDPQDHGRRPAAMDPHRHMI